jgi:hypothetical protein
VKRKLVTNIWRQRRTIGGPWGWCYEVVDADTDADIAAGWRATEANAREALESAVKDAIESGGYEREESE